MISRKTTRGSMLAAATIAGTLLLSACGESSGSGGDTTCKAYLAMDDSNRNTVVTQFAKEEGETGLSDDEIEMAAGLFGMMCGMVKDDSVKLNNLDDLDDSDLDMPDLDDLDLPDLDDLDIPDLD